MLFYLMLKEDGTVSYAPSLKFDQHSDVISYLSPPLSLSNILLIQKRTQRRNFFFFRNKERKWRDTQLEILKSVQEFGWKAQTFIWQDVVPSAPLIIRDRRNQRSDSEAQKAFQSLVLGRQLSFGDLRGLAKELKIEVEEITELAHSCVLAGKAQWVPALKRQGSGWQCQRCGEVDVEEWPSFYGMAATCRSCESIGSCTSLDVLYRDQRPLLDGGPADVLFQPHWILTEAQRLASDQVLGFITDDPGKTALLWAACGAGKTEVCFPSAAWALKQGKSVLFAAPRQDVINDVVPRLQRDFPGYPLQVLTGMAPTKFQTGRMVLATTHQVLRFWRAFDVVFMDEMDAFPYHGNGALEWGLNHALRPDGKMLYLTATPSPEGLKGVQRGQTRLIRLPARHHRVPLPIPIWEKSHHSLDPHRCLGAESTLLETLRLQGPILVFVPKISWIDPWVKCLQQQFPQWCVDGSYSSDPGRLAKLSRLRQGKYDLFVTTTILERGITLAQIQVVVLAADHPVFDERALVQMAGRVGRTRESPKGNAVFVAQQMTTAMKTAVQWIKEQNKCARELGLIEA